ncbi:hypothetical protein [Marixanthomonas spongiae]|nr:hypothetical protein [Marixanthomonas spongiae]
MIRFQFFPRSNGITSEIQAVINCFNTVTAEISSEDHQHNSNHV